jgi:hypothetical protein
MIVKRLMVMTAAIILLIPTLVVVPNIHGLLESLMTVKEALAANASPNGGAAEDGRPFGRP